MWGLSFLILPYLIEVAVPSQESERSCICALELSIVSTTFIFEFAIIPTVWYILFIIWWMKETSFGYTYNYEQNQYFTCSSSCIIYIFVKLYFHLLRIVVLLELPLCWQKTLKETYHASLINLGSFNWNVWSKPRKSNKSCICVLRITILSLFTIFSI